MSKRKLYKIDKIISDRRDDLKHHANVYHNDFSDKKVTYYYHVKGVPKRRTIFFYRRNFMHLCGVKWYKDGGWKGFYYQSVEGTVDPNKTYTLQPKYVNPKIDVLRELPKLLDSKSIGFSEGSIVHKNTNYGEMLRTRDNIVALGTVRDRKTNNLVPMSIINLKVSEDDMKKTVSEWSKISSLRVENVGHGVSRNSYDKDNQWNNKRKQLNENRLRKKVKNK